MFENFTEWKKRKVQIHESKKLHEEDNKYQEFVKKELAKTGKTLAQMSKEEKASFFEKIDKKWKSDAEKGDED
jgi:hypothetical protein